MQPSNPPERWELAGEIDYDGLDHFNRFTEMKQTLLAYRGAGAPLPYLRPVKPGTKVQARDALASVRALLAALNDAYLAQWRREPEAAQAAINLSRTVMDQLRLQAEALAQRGIGVPFFLALQ